MGVEFELDGHVGIVTINRPDRANSIDLETARTLSARFDECALDARVRAVVITGAGGRVFCAGMDLRAIEAGQASMINGVRGGFAGIVRRDFDKPIIAAVNGAALGGGFEIALACDLIVAAANARFGLPEVGIGLFAASGGAVRVALRMPKALANEILLVGEPIDAARALDLGLINRVVDEGQAVAAACALAARVARNAPLAVQASKRISLEAARRGEDAAWRVNDELAARISVSDDATEGARASRERRDPSWTTR